MNLSALNFSELRSLQEAVTAELKLRAVQEREALRNELVHLAQSRGFSVDELFSDKIKQKGAPGRKVSVKYRHPLDASLSWSGRGRKPKWVETWLAEQGSMEALLVA